MNSSDKFGASQSEKIMSVVIGYEELLSEQTPYETAEEEMRNLMKWGERLSYYLENPKESPMSQDELEDMADRYLNYHGGPVDGISGSSCAGP